MCTKKKQQLFEFVIGDFDVYSRLDIQGVQLKNRSYFNMSNLFTKIYKMLYYTTKLYLQ